MRSSLQLLNPKIIDVTKGFGIGLIQDYQGATSSFQDDWDLENMLNVELDNKLNTKWEEELN